MSRKTTIGQVRVEVLTALSMKPGTVAQVAERTGRTPAQVRKAVDELCGIGQAREVRGGRIEPMLRGVRHG